MCASTGKPKRRPIDLFQEEKPHLLSLPARPYDTARVLYRTVNPEGHVMYLQNFYSVPWQRIGELLPVRITEKELIVYGPDVKEIARHELYPSGITGEKHSLAGAFSGTRSPSEIRVAEGSVLPSSGAEGCLFFDELLRTRRCGKDEAARVLGLLATYHREDLARALERAVRYRAFSWSRGGADPGGAGAPALGVGIAGNRSAGTTRRDPPADSRSARSHGGVSGAAGRNGDGR